MLTVALILLAVVTAVLFTAVLSLSSDVTALKSSSTSFERWPFRVVRPGDALPSCVGVASKYTGFIVVTSDRHDAYGEVMAVRAIAREWEQPMAIIVADSGQPSGWTQRLPEDARQHAILVARGCLDDFAPEVVPSVVFADDGVVQHAAAMPMSPTHIVDHFAALARPLPGNGIAGSATYGIRDDEDELAHA